MAGTGNEALQTQLEQKIDIPTSLSNKSDNGVSSDTTCYVGLFEKTLRLVVVYFDFGHSFFPLPVFSLTCVCGGEGVWRGGSRMRRAEKNTL